MSGQNSNGGRGGGGSGSLDGGRIKVPIELDGFDVQRTSDGWKVCGFVEAPGIGRIPVCKKISDEEATAFFRKAIEDAEEEYSRFKRRGGLRGWWDRTFGGGKK